MNSGLASTVTLPLHPDVIKRAQQGDSEAFAAIFQAHKTRIYSLCLRMIGNVTEAEDLTQDAFLQAFRKLATFRGDSALSTWLHRIAVNTVLMRFRRKLPCRVSLDEPYRNQGETKPAREFGTRDGRLETSVNRLALARAISDLPEGYRTMFVLHEVEGYEHREIAEMLGCSIGTSKSQLHKAKMRMREILAPSNKSNKSYVAPSGGDSSVAAGVPPSAQTTPRWKLPMLPARAMANTMPLAHSNACLAAR